MLSAIFRAGRLVIMAGLSTTWLLSISAPSNAAPISRVPAPEYRALSPLPIQAPAPAPNIEANIARLHQQLQITPAQEPRFAALANVMRENARMMPSPPPAANSNAVDDLRLAIQVGEQEVSGLRRLLPALEALYASLSPAQQQIANQVFRQGPGE